MSKLSIAAAAVGLMVLGVSPAGAWMRGGYTPSGGHWGAAGGDGHWAGDWNGHTGGGTYGTTANGTHYATTNRGGTATASDGSWSSESASGRTNGGTYGTTAYGTHYATGSYGGAVATNNGSWAAGRNGQYAYGSTYSGAGGYGYHPPAVVNQYLWNWMLQLRRLECGRGGGGRCRRRCRRGRGGRRGGSFERLCLGIRRRECVCRAAGRMHLHAHRRPNLLPVQRRLVRPRLWRERDLLQRRAGPLTGTTR